MNLLSYQMTFLNKGSNVICLNWLTIEDKVMVHTLTNSNSTTTPMAKLRAITRQKLMEI